MPPRVHSKSTDLAPLRPTSAHGAHTRDGDFHTIAIRRKQSYASETFLRHEDARQWATATERRIDLGDAPVKRAKVDPTTFEHLIDLHFDDMCEVGKAPRRTKPLTLEALRQKLGRTKLKELTRERLIQFGKDRAKGCHEGLDVDLCRIGYQYDTGDRRSVVETAGRQARRAE